MAKKHHPKNPRLKAVEKSRHKKVALNQAIPVNIGVNNLPVKEKRLGWFAMSAQLLDALTFEQCQKIFSNFVIVRAEPMPKQPIFKYQAFSPLFEPYLSKVSPPPWYDVKVKLIPPKKPDGKMRIQVTAKKREQSRIIRPGG